MRPALTILVLVSCLSATRAGTPPGEPLVDQVRRSIDRGKEWIIRQQSREGHFEIEKAADQRPGGWTALALLALLNAGVPADDPVIRNGLTWLRTIPLHDTYVVGLQTMVFCQVGATEDRERIQRNVKWLLETRQMSGERLMGWPYRKEKLSRPDTDNSNTQYAILGLHEAHVHGFPIDPEVWRGVRDYYISTQRGGGWGYKLGDPPTLTMTTAGLCGLLSAGMDLNAGREILKGGRWTNCGDYEENRAVSQALEWIAERFPTGAALEGTPHLYYALYGFERAGRLSGLRFFGRHDWYRSGCEVLVRRQLGDGSWRGSHEGAWPIVSTSFSLLFLSRGRTPILVSKLVHDGRDGAKLYRDDWNNDRNDVRHLTEFVGRELFRRQPVGWQVFNAREVETATGDELVAELLPSPVAFLNGHFAPDFGREGRMKDVLRKYVENGGCILAEACCHSEAFDRGFRELMKELFPDTPLTPLPPEHPIWSASGKLAVTPTDRFPLWGIQMGCKTVVIYSPRDLSCWWEANKHDDGDGRTAFRLGANILAYATGLEVPRPRLTQGDVFAEEGPARTIPRGFFKVAQLRHEGDWQPAPRAMPTLMREIREKRRLDVALKTEEVNPRLPEVIDYKFLYMHGRRDFRIEAARLEHLRFNLETGGLLLADACCGAAEFDKAFRQLVEDLWPGRKLEPVLLTDDLYSAELNGTAITEVRCRREVAGKPSPEYLSLQPTLEGIRVNGRWAILYSRYDLGCALEKTRSPNCLGHDYDSAVRLGMAVVLYALKR